MAAGSQVVSKASLGGGEAGFLVEGTPRFKVVWTMCPSPTAPEVLTVVAGSPLGKPPLLVPKTLARTNSPSHTHTPHMYTHAPFTPSITHTLSLTAILPATILISSRLIFYILELIILHMVFEK